MQTDEPHARTGPSFDALRLAVDRGRGMPEHDPAHAPGKRRIGRTADAATPRQVRIERQKHQPWVPTSGLVGRKRRSARRG